jgi:flagellum-specific ATP synthase
MMAKNTSADMNVIALVGERGREVREFIENFGQDDRNYNYINYCDKDILI